MLQRYDRKAKTIRLHDVFRRYLIDAHGGKLQELHQQWLDAHCPVGGHWHALPRGEQYAWRWLAYHLRGACQIKTLGDLLCDVMWLDAKIRAAGAAALIADYAYVEHRGAGNENVEVAVAIGDFEHLARSNKADRGDYALIAGALRLSSHVLARDVGGLRGQLVGRLGGYEGVDGRGGGEVTGPERGAVKRLLRSVRRTQLGAWLSPVVPRLTAPGGPLLRTLSGHADTVIGVAVTPDGALSASWDNTLKLWDLHSGTELRTLSGHTDTVAGVAVTHDGHRALSASRDNTLKLWDLHSGAVLRTLSGHTNWVTGVAVTPDGHRALSASDDCTLKLWDLHSGALLRTLSDHSDTVTEVATTLDGNQALSTSWDNTLKLWDLHTGIVLASFAADAPLSAAAASPRADLIIAGDARGAVHVLRLISPTSEPNLRIAAPQTGPSLDIAARAGPFADPSTRPTERAKTDRAEPNRAAFERLLCSLFGAAALRRFVSHGTEGAAILTEDLPGENATPAAHAHAAVAAWLRRGLITLDLFTRLINERPNRAAEIVAIRRQWLPDD